MLELPRAVLKIHLHEIIVLTHVYKFKMRYSIHKPFKPYKPPEVTISKDSALATSLSENLQIYTPLNVKRVRFIIGGTNSKKKTHWISDQEQITKKVIPQIYSNELMIEFKAFLN